MAPVQNISVEASESDAHPEGGFALLVLAGLETAPARPRLRLKPIDQQAGGDPKRHWTGASIVPDAAYITARGLELVIGPDVVANPALLAGTPVVIEVPEMGLRGEFLWPNVRPLAQPKRRHVLVVPKSASAIAAGTDTPAAILADQIPIAASASAAFTSEGPSEADADLPPALVAAIAAGGTPPAREAAQRMTVGFPTQPAGLSPAPALPAPDAVSTGSGAKGRAGPAAGAQWHATSGRRGPFGRIVLPAAASIAFIALVYFATNGRPAVSRTPPHTGVETTAGRPTTKPGAPVRTAANAATPARASDAEPADATAGAAGSAPASAAPAACAPDAISTEALDAGLMQLTIAAPCRARQSLAIAYGGVVLERSLDPAGRLSITIDCFAEPALPVEITFADGVQRAVAVTTRGLDKATKVALVWRAPIDLDLHAYEYAAAAGEKGHVWSQSPSSLAAASADLETDRRAHGFMSTGADRHVETGPGGDRLVVFTLLHAGGQTSGSVALAVDYATRGDVPAGQSCGKGPLAEVAFSISVRQPNGQVTRQAGQFAAAPCGQRLSEPVRYLRSGMPVLRIRK